MTKRAALSTLFLLLCAAGAACGSKKEGAASDSKAAAGDSKPDGDSKAAGKDLADSAEATGLTWKRTDVPFGSVELPQGEGWSLPDSNQAEGPDGVVIMMQAQDGIEPDQIDDYLSSYDDVQKRDAPKYARTSQDKGKVAGQVAARVEGTFDNGTKFVTRDFLVFSKGKVVLLGSRIPAEHAAKLPSIIDHIVRSLQVK